MVDIRALILETIQNLRQDLNIPMRTIQAKIENLERNISTVPSMEKALLEQKRTQSIKENLFLFLLQKREETALSEAVTAPNTRIVDRARTPKFPIFPQTRMIYMACAALGLIVPLLLVTLLGFFETKIQAEDMITDLTSIPILGRIALSKKKEDIVVKKGTRSAIAEMFRLLRTNLNYLNIKNEKQVLVITSSVSGEGKSFIGLNLSMTIALSNKKVILLGLDMRKPKMHQYLGVENGVGMSNYLVQQAELEDVVRVFPENKNLSYITSGAIPPNPAELILSDRMKELITRLKEEYDYIIIDTPPIGLVSDALLLREYVSNIMVVVRQKYTQKTMVRDLETLYKNDELKGAGIVFNAVKMGRGYYGYGGYNYGYGQGYYTSEDD
jgi:capsular exopolysaccharide synthesis family protein